jgi:hypothetical protein
MMSHGRIVKTLYSQGQDAESSGDGEWGDAGGEGDVLRGGGLGAS